MTYPAFKVEVKNLVPPNHKLQLQSSTPSQYCRCIFMNRVYGASLWKKSLFNILVKSTVPKAVDCTCTCYSSIQHFLGPGQWLLCNSPQHSCSSLPSCGCFLQIQRWWLVFRMCLKIWQISLLCTSKWCLRKTGCVNGLGYSHTFIFQLLCSFNIRRGGRCLWYCQVVVLHKTQNLRNCSGIDTSVHVPHCVDDRVIWWVTFRRELRNISVKGCGTARWQSLELILKVVSKHWIATAKGWQ